MYCFQFCDNVGDLKIISGVGSEGISDVGLNTSAGGSRSGWEQGLEEWQGQHREQG